jgi:hypothetical protein
LLLFFLARHCQSEEYSRKKITRRNFSGDFVEKNNLEEKRNSFEAREFQEKGVLLLATLLA